MEAIGRVHQITKAFLQQACLDVERNGLETVIHLPSLKKYRDIFNSPCSNVPVIARNAVGRHSEISPVLPGRLPLDKPKGRLPPANLRLTKSHFSPPDQELQCFQPMLGAVTRNISGSNARNDRNDTSESHKRKRMSSSPVPSRRVDLGLMGMSTRDSGEIHMSVDHQGPGLAPEIPNASNGKPRNKQHSNVTLPDRTNSSASSSPLNRASGYADTQSGSSHTSPGVFGLGNTAEENRVDLRPFQDRVATPIWQTMADEVFFGQITDTMVNNALAIGSDPWGILNGELDWGIDPSAE